MPICESVLYIGIPFPVNDAFVGADTMLSGLSHSHTPIGVNSIGASVDSWTSDRPAIGD